MKRTLNKLSARFVATAKPRKHSYSDGGGLYFYVEESGAKRWSFVFFLQGKRREKGLGSINDVDLATARQLRADCRKILAAGGDPIAEARAAKKTTPAFGEFGDEFLKTKGAGWRNAKHRQQWTNTLATYAASLRAKPVNEIKTEDVLSILKPVWQAKPETASRLRGRIERILDAARAAGHRQGENPATWTGHLDQLLPKPQKLRRGHHAAMA